MTITTGKSEYLYDHIFSDIKKIIIENGNKLDDIPKRIMSDFEKGLINSIRKNFENSVVDGCFFHFVKLFWKKAKSLGLCKIKNLKNTKILLFILKLIPFLEIDQRGELFDKLEIFYSSINESYKKLLNYYKKNWLNNEYINYCELDNKELLNRTNNYIESFHSYFNKILETLHPKISYLISKYKEYLLLIYNRVKSSLVNKYEKKIEKFSVVKDIVLFIKNINQKYKDGLNLNNILQGDEENNDIINKVADYLLEFYFDLDLEKNDKDSSIDEDEQDLNSDSEKLNQEDSINKIENMAENDNEFLNFDETFPLKKLKLSKKKRNYLEAFGPSNELKQFHENLKLNKFI